jgi:preprotein translocase subunit SecG
MDESARSGISRKKSIALFAILIISIAVAGVILVHSQTGGPGGAAVTRSLSSTSGLGGATTTTTTSNLTTATCSSSTTTIASLSTMRVSNSSSLCNLEVAATNLGGDLYNPVLDSNAGLIYGLSFSQDDSNTILTAVNTSSLASRTVLTLPGTGLAIAVDVKTSTIYVSILGCIEGVQTPNSCSSNPSGFFDREILRVNGSTGAIEGQTAIQTNESFIGIDSNTDTLYAVQSCPHVNLSSPCGRLLAFNATTGSLAQNLTVKAFLSGLVVNQVTGMVYTQGSWDLPASQSGDNHTLGIVAFQYPPPNLQVDFIVPLNYTNTIDLSVDESTNTVYGFADNIVGNESSANLVAVDGANGYVIFSKVVGTACSLYDSQGGSAATPEGATVNTSTNQVYLDTTQGDSTLVALDGTTGQVVGMVPAPSPIDNSLFDSQSGRLFVFLEGGSVAAIPGAVIEGGVNSAILNAGCPIEVPELNPSIFD